MERAHGRSLIVAAICVWIVATGIRWAAAPPLGHDEARYALSGGDLLGGHLPRWDYAPPGIAAIAVPGMVAGGSERALRLLPVLLNLGFLAAAALLARRLARETAIWAICVLAGTLPILRLSGDLLSDLPSATLLLVGLAILLAEQITWRVVAVAPIFACAFYVRYGSCVPIAIIGAGVLAWRWRAIAARPWPIIATAGAFAALLVPHVVMARAIDGSALGILRASAAMPAPGRGLVDYVIRPFAMYGILGPPLIIAALAGALHDRKRALLVAIAVAQIIVLGLQTQAQPRYVFLATTLLVIAGVDTVRAHLGRIAAAAVAVTWVAVIVSAVRSGRALRAEDAPTLAAAAAIRADAAGRPCLVMGRRRMQLEWYSGCVAIMFVPQTRPLFYAVRDAANGPDEPDLAALPGHHIAVLHDPRVDVIRCDN